MVNQYALLPMGSNGTDGRRNQSMRTYFWTCLEIVSLMKVSGPPELEIWETCRVAQRCNIRACSLQNRNQEGYGRWRPDDHSRQRPCHWHRHSHRCCQTWERWDKTIKWRCSRSAFFLKRYHWVYDTVCCRWSYFSWSLINYQILTSGAISWEIVIFSNRTSCALAITRSSSRAIFS